MPAALWRKHRMGDLTAPDARLLSSAFAADLVDAFAVVGATPGVLDAATDLAAVHVLRAYDAVQLAARDADPECRRFACFDHDLRAAASARGFELVP